MESPHTNLERNDVHTMSDIEISPASLIEHAIRSIDRAAGSSPDTPEGRERLARHLGIARYSLTKALSSVQAMPVSSSTASITAYLETNHHFAEAEDAALQVIHQVVPLPLNEERISLKDIQASSMPKQLIELILATINDGRVDDGQWMQNGGFTYHAGLNYCQIENGHRQTWQAIRLTSAGAVFMRERWTEKSGYSFNRFHAMLEATLAFTNHVIKSFNLSIDRIALQSTFFHANDIKLGIVTDLGTSFFNPSFSETTVFHTPSTPLQRDRNELAAPKELASLLATDLRTKFKQHPNDQPQ